MRNGIFRTAVVAALLAFLGFMGLLVGLAVSERVPGSPVASSMGLVAAAMTGQGNDIPDAAAVAAFSASRWYEKTVLPALVGILVGLVIGLFLRPRPSETLLGGALFGLLALLFRSDPFDDITSWLGALLFTFCLLGAAHLVGSLRGRERERAVTTTTRAT